MFKISRSGVGMAGLAAGAFFAATFDTGLLGDRLRGLEESDSLAGDWARLEWTVLAGACGWGSVF